MVRVRLDGLFTLIHLILCLLIPLLIFLLPPSVEVCYSDDASCWDDKNGDSCTDGEHTIRVCDFSVILAGIQLGVYCSFCILLLLSGFLQNLMVLNTLVAIHACCVMIFEFIMLLACPILFFSSPHKESCETGSDSSCSDIMDHIGLFYVFWASRFMGVVLWCTVVAKEVKTRGEYVALPDSPKRSFYQTAVDYLMFLQWKPQPAQVNDE